MVNEDNNNNDSDSYIKTNQLAWNNAASRHQNKFKELSEKFKTPGYSYLNDIETDILLNKLQLKGKSVAQICCNNGRELLSIKNLGAARCVGFDFSEQFIAQAKELTTIAQVECEFITADAYNLPTQFHKQFDLVYISAGSLGWLKDLQQFFNSVRSLLNENGQLFIYEIHPLLDMYDPTDTQNPSQLVNSYFTSEPLVSDGGLDYLNGIQHQAEKQIWFHHQLLDIIKISTELGFTLEDTREFPHDVSAEFGHFENQSAQLPLSYILIAKVDNPILIATLTHENENLKQEVEKLKKENLQLLGTSSTLFTHPKENEMKLNNELTNKPW